MVRRLPGRRPANPNALTSTPMSIYAYRAEIRAAVDVWAEMRATKAWIIYCKRLSEWPAIISTEMTYTYDVNVVLKITLTRKPLVTHIIPSAC